MLFSPQQFKQQFPLFSQPENCELVYLDNAATTHRPQVVIDAVADFYRTSNANTHRSSHRLARRATEMVEATRIAAGRFLNAAEPSEVIFTRGSTEGLNLLASSLTENLSPGDEIVLTTAEHHANLVPWQMAAQRHDLILKFVPHKNGVPQFDRVEEVLSERTKIVSVTAASNALGFMADLGPLKQVLADRNIRWIVDAAQLAAHQVVDAQTIGCDFLVCSAHKFYGPTGVGLLYGRRESLAALPPWQGGGEMIEQVQLQSSTYGAPPHRFETGTSSLAAIAGLGACLQFLQQLDRDAMAAYEQQLTDYLHQQLQKLPGIDLLSNAESNVGIATFAPAVESALQATDIAHWLDGRDIAVRAGRHCAMPLMELRSGHGSSVRASIAAYNSRNDIDRLIESLQNCLAATQSNSSLVTTADADHLEELSIEQLRQQRGWQQRYRQLMKWADAIAPKPGIRTVGNRVRGCEAATWVSHRMVDDRHQFFIDSEARVVKGLAALLLLLVNNKTTAEIAALDMDALFADLGLEKHLSPSRSNGFRALVNRVLQLSGSLLG
ncbi:aminotransferase class V-fold PLP-dependent enzyme [Porticoccus sp. W117]|uniref:aminotransferase class V-fold PLP-dependent enzyme n=1 Tax=Porticoccus sp. W117 TaxID=3054777 RepID=UPI0025937ACD|nr:aminotransferase class V-fold PLP-dependent enzyme [Porticoccus sp. W117]MDM3871462.1 aminotransferase class V-fold PLP-dependent enzyme [Porticoccus sp. W117]